ncbi:MAG: MarR family winged helix-turn-helix transcriptional regulator [Betaproteobacteria bacterium]|nr:MarR family winged helix-turn-helix transcriptional regulator [Betaproteobacteria bacterium]
MAKADRILFDFTIAIQPARRAWVQAIHAKLADDKLPVSLAVAIVLASRMGAAAHQRMLATEIGINPAALMRVLDYGESAGLLKRCNVPGNRRIKTIQLLPAGKALAEKMETAWAALRAGLLCDIPLADVETATRVLRMLEAQSLAYTAASELPGKNGEPA